MSNKIYSFQILMKIAFSRHIFKKILKYKIFRKSVHWEPSCSMRTEAKWKERHEEHFSRFSQFCGSAYKRSCSVRTSHTMQRNTRIILRNTNSLSNYYKQIKVSEPALSAFNTAIERACMFNVTTNLRNNVKNCSQ
jgi:hypothetical protein